MNAIENQSTSSIEKKMSLGLYCHVPFCAHQCDYCAFYKEPPTAKTIALYLDCIDREMNLINFCPEFDTIYIGGGTPGVLTPAYFERLCTSLTKYNHKKKFDEFSVEFSPSTIQRQKLEVLMSYGCNRVTIGVQSFSEKTLKSLGRRQTEKQVLDGYDTVVSSGIKNVGIDMIFGVPGQTIDEWISDLRCAIDLCPQHISTYNLTFEGDSKLNHDLTIGNIEKKDEVEEAEFYTRTWEFLEQNGYKQYEISNFCMPGFESIHNLNTWRMNEWIGVGPSACSQYANRRFSNPCSLDRWSKNISNGALSYENVTKISKRKMAEDYLVFGLRTRRGVDLSTIEQNFPEHCWSNFLKLLGSLEKECLAKVDKNILSLTTKGLLVSDSIAVEILSVL